MLTSIKDVDVAMASVTEDIDELVPKYVIARAKEAAAAMRDAHARCVKVLEEKKTLNFKDLIDGIIASRKEAGTASEKLTGQVEDARAALAGA